jgi:spermidine synthase
MDGVSTLLVFELEVIGLALVVAGPALFLAGIVLPTVFEWLAREHGDLHGRSWGVVLAANGVGGMAGAELTHRFLVPTAGFYVSAGIIACAYASVGLVLAWPTTARRLRWISVTTAAAILATIVGLTATLLHRLPDLWEGLQYRVLAKETGREGLIAVVEHESRGRGILMNSMYFLGGTAAEHEERRQAHLPLLLHPQPRDVLFIGLATGLTAVAALDHATVEKVSTVELSELVVRASREHFSDVSGAIHTSPKVEVVVEDGRTFVAAAPARFDVVVGDLFLPWRAGVGRLYSVEHFEGVRTALRTGGVFAQWLPAHQLSRQQLDVVLASVAEVFPHVFLFRGNFSRAAMPLAVVALRDDEALAWDDLERRCQLLRRTGVRDPLMRHAAGLGLLYLGPLRRDRLDDVPVNTLGNAWLELDAGRRRVSGNRSDHYLVHERWVAVERDLTLPRPAAAQASLDLADLMARGRAIIGVPRNRRLDAGEKVKLRSQVIGGFPEAMLEDDAADWGAARVLGQLLGVQRPAGPHR